MRVNQIFVCFDFYLKLEAGCKLEFRLESSTDNMMFGSKAPPVF